MPQVSQAILLRFAAFFVDALICALLLVLPASALSYGMAWVGGSRAVSAVWNGALLVLMLAMLLRDGIGGRSPGKRLFGLKILVPGGEGCSYGRSFARNFPLIIVGWNLVELFLVVFSQGSRRTGDRMAHTRVVEE